MVTDEIKMSQILSGRGRWGGGENTWPIILNSDLGKTPPSPQEGLHYGQVKMKCLNRWINQQ